MKPTVTVKQSIFIREIPSLVWDFTQDYEKRVKWDSLIAHATILQIEPYKLVAIKGKGRLNTRFKYKLEERPYKSSLSMIETKSLLIEGGGGSWKYQAKDFGTLWTQTNTLILKSHLTIFKPLVKMFVQKAIVRGMKKAKFLIEKSINHD